MAAADQTFVDLDRAAKQLALRRDHGAAQLVQHQPRRLVAHDPELALKLDRRHPRRVGATRYPAQNHSVNGVLVACITVPAVTEVCLPHVLHCHTLRRCSTPIESAPQARQT